MLSLKMPFENMHTTEKKIKIGANISPYIIHIPLIRRFMIYDCIQFDWRIWFHENYAQLYMIRRFGQIAMHTHTRKTNWNEIVRKRQKDFKPCDRK